MLKMQNHACLVKYPPQKLCANIQDCDQECPEVQDGIISKMADINCTNQNHILMIIIINQDPKADTMGVEINLILHSIMTCAEQGIKAIIEIIMALTEIKMRIIIIMGQKQNLCPNTLPNKTEMLNMAGAVKVCLQGGSKEVPHQCFIALR